MDLPLRLTPRVSLSLGGKDWPVLFSHQALLDVETSTGLDILAGEFKVTMLSAKAMRATVHALLAVAALPSPPPYTVKEVGKLIGLKTLGKVRNALVEAWRAAMPEMEPGVPPSHAGAKPKVGGPGARTWMEIWADNRQSLNLSDEQWLAYTPRMVQQLARERLEVIRRQELMLSRIGAATVNFSMCAPKNPVADTHFMVHPWPKPEPATNLLGSLGGMPDLFPLARKLMVEKAQQDRRDGQAVNSGERK